MRNFLSTYRWGHNFHSTAIILDPKSGEICRTSNKEASKPADVSFFDVEVLASLIIDSLRSFSEKQKKTFLKLGKQTHHSSVEHFLGTLTHFKSRWHDLCFWIYRIFFWKVVLRETRHRLTQIPLVTQTHAIAMVTHCRDTWWAASLVYYRLTG